MEIILGMEEIFKDVIGFEGLYQVSNYGNVKSLQRKVTGMDGKKYSIKGRMLKLSDGDNGYFVVSLCNGHLTHKTCPVHTLVWDMFGDASRDKYNLEVDHKDENRKNNYIGNLQLLTIKQNLRKAIKKKKDVPLGVHKQDGKFRARVWQNDKLISIGFFNCPTKASLAYQKYCIDNGIN